MSLVKLDLERRLGVIDRKTYGMFIEHLGRCVYGGVYEPGSPLSDEHGFRRDVLDAARALRPSILRYPGGNFVSGYHWLDGVGPRERRPIRMELAWRTTESNQFGTNEYLSYCRALGAEPFICANLGSGSMEEAAAWVEYCNREAGTSYADLRAEHGFRDPHKVTHWGLGNEIYGDWQIGHKSAADYARFARECAKLMRWVDPSIKLVLCGGQNLDWDCEALARCADLVDYISYHFYWSPVRGQDPHYSTLAQPYRSEQYLRFLWQLIEQVRRERGVKHPIRIAVDEWNAWFVERAGDQLADHYNLTDALSVAIYLNMLRRNCRAVGLATLAQMVNVIAPIFTSPAGMFLQTIYHPLRLAVEKSGPIALDAHVECDTYPAAYLGLPAIPYLDALATFDDQTGQLFVSLVNLSKDRPQKVDLRMQDFGLAAEGLAYVVTGEAPDVVNDFDSEPVTVVTQPLAGLSTSIVYTLPPLTHAVLELRLS
jgi:alpha-N-arabinofuranosidase